MHLKHYVSQPFHWMNHLCTLNSVLYHLFTFSYSHTFRCLQVIFATCRYFQRCISCYYPLRNRIWWKLEIYTYFCVQKLDTAVANLPVVRLWSFINSPVSMDVGFSVCAYVVSVKVYVLFGWSVGIWWLSAGFQAVVNTTWILLLIFKYPVPCCISALYFTWCKLTPWFPFTFYIHVKCCYIIYWNVVYCIECAVPTCN